jgi:hypothetical protein
MNDIPAPKRKIVAENGAKKRIPGNSESIARVYITTVFL